MSAHLHSPGLSKPTTHSKWPSIEFRSQWTILDGWDSTHYTALRRTLLNHDTHGDYLTQQILWLFHSGLNLPMKFADDQRLLFECVKNHDELMRDMHPCCAPAWVKPFTEESLRACFDKHLEHLLGVGE